ncbi:hypothetical protein ACFP9U_06765 [Nitratireductor sp. GCM10026969]
MLIFTLAATMTLTMLIATAFGLRHEAQRDPSKGRIVSVPADDGRTETYGPTCSSPSPFTP